MLRGPLVSRARGLLLVASVVDDAAGLVGGVVGERLEDGVGDGRRHGQVGALRLEAVLVGGVGDGVADVVGRREGEGALRGQGTLRAVVPQLAALLGGRAILRLVAETDVDLLSKQCTQILPRLNSYLQSSHHLVKSLSAL